MSSRFYSWLLSGAFAGMMFSLSGCGGGDTTVASAPPANTPTQTPAAAAAPAESAAPAKEQSSYGSEQKSTNAGGNSGGGGSSGGAGGSSGNDRALMAIGDEGGGGDGYTPPGSGGPGSGPPGMGSGAPGVNSGGGMMSSGGMMNTGGGTGGTGGVGRGARNLGDGGGAPGMGMNSGGGFGPGGEMGFGGEGGSFDGSFGGGADLTQLTTFLRESCVSCHSSGNAKGGIVLDQVGADLKSNAQLWSSVAEAIETGAMPPRNARQPDASRKAAVVQLIRQLLDGKGVNGPAEKSFMDRAEMAFRKGDHDKAMSLFYAQLITADSSEATELANHFKLYKPTPKEADKLAPANDSAVAVKPKLVTSLNLAVGVLLKAGQGVTEVKPVGVNQAGAAGGGGMSEGPGGPGVVGGRGPGGGGGGGGGGNLGMSKMEAFEDLTGDVGRQIVSSFDSRRAAGKFGTLFSSLNEDAGPSFGPFGGGAMGGGAGGFAPGGGEGEGLAGAASMGGAPAGGRGAGGMPGGGMGPAGGMGPGMGGGMAGGMGEGMGMGGSPARASRTMAGKNLANGLLYIGKADTANALFKKAMEAGVDGLIIVEVEANKNMRTGIVTNETRFRFMLPSGKIVATSSKTIKNTEVEIKQDTEIVQKQVDAMFNQMDSVLNVVDLPQISAASAMKQLHSKIHAGGDRLQILAETRMYHAKGIISNDQLETVYQVVLEGNEGVALANGTADDKKLVMTSFTEKL